MNGWAVADVAALAIFVVLLVSKRARKPLYLLADWAEDWWLASREKRRMRADEQASEAAYWRRFGAVPHDVFRSEDTPHGAWKSGQGPAPRVRPYVDAPTLFENRSGGPRHLLDVEAVECKPERVARHAAHDPWAQDQLTAILEKVSGEADPTAVLAPAISHEIEMIPVGRQVVEVFDVERDSFVTPNPAPMRRVEAPVEHTGADESWSPLAEDRAVQLAGVFTATELLPQRTVMVAIHEPDEKALQKDTEAAFDAAFGRVDEYMETWRQMPRDEQDAGLKDLLESTSLWTEDDQHTLAAMLAADDADLSATAKHRALVAA